MKEITVTTRLGVGEEVTWLHTPRGGYGYTNSVPSRIVKIGPKRVQIAAKLARGGEKLVWVNPLNLRWP